ncbi:twin-arginine translocation signal domain-containing protein, partial [Arthrospira platensis SPKY1]|nr:twin-arginine translocation signal domain-containing protein [Arthrospira platensis SPKY1]
MTKIPSSEITPKQVYLSRRDFIKAAGVLAGSMALAACGVSETLEPTPAATREVDPNVKTDELGDPANSYTDVTNYNN